VSRPSLVVLAGGMARRFGGIKPLAKIGPSDEAVLDYLVHDAAAAGFERVVLVLNPTTGPAIAEHVRANWDPAFIEVDFATQQEPHGTVHAVLAAREQLDPSRPFAVSNADDLYGTAALKALVEHLDVEHPTNALVSFRLDQTIVTAAPVTRGVCAIDDHGHLVRIDERRQVHTKVKGTFGVDDGREPAILPPTALVSMNLWGFAPQMWSVFETAMERPRSAETEVLLPEVVDDLLHDRIPDAPHCITRFTVFSSHERCIGVTHQEDLEPVRAALREQIEAGLRPARLVGSLYR